MNPKFTLREKAGQLLISGFEGIEMNAEIEHLIVQEGIGGFVLFERNYKNPEQLAHLIRGMQNLAMNTAGVPIFVSIDQEGGRVCRLKEPFSSFPFQFLLGRAGSSDLAFRFGKALGKELRSIGINVNYSPVLDVNTNPSNPIIGERAISGDAEITARMGSAIIEGILEAGVIPVGKHFPGHGHTELDSHLALPVVCKDVKTLEKEELLPFIFAAKGPLPMIMTAHVIYQNWDKMVPATFSKFILTDLLRIKLGFEGVIVSDDLEMQAVGGLPFGSMALRGLNAGLDLFMVCHDVEKTLALRSQIVHSVEQGTITPARVNESLERVLKLKSTLNPEENLDPSKLNSLVSNHKELIEEIKTYL